MTTLATIPTERMNRDVAAITTGPGLAQYLYDHADELTPAMLEAVRLREAELRGHS